jgi:hypothetical protein
MRQSIEKVASNTVPVISKRPHIGKEKRIENKNGKVQLMIERAKYPRMMLAFVMFAPAFTDFVNSSDVCLLCY